MRILAAMDKFKGTLPAAEAAGAVCRGAAGHECDPCPVGDGGEGTIEAFGGPNRTSTVIGPHGGPVAAEWRLADSIAYVEMAKASGMAVTGGRHDPVTATSFGTGQLIAEAVRLGAREIIVGAGGSATSDGGQGALEALDNVLVAGRLPVPVTVLCDVDLPFLDAARVFGPQKGANQKQVDLLTDRLAALHGAWLNRIDVNALAGSGSAGGLAGGLASVGATLQPGFPRVAEQLGLTRRIAGADLVITGEGTFDDTSMQGKAVGGVIGLAGAAGVPVVVVAGTTTRPDPAVISLVERYGQRSLTDPASCIAKAVAAWLSGVTGASL